jgi:alkylhydroperoxidase/carboxymuconolactone decarboxylase family protein YurZ
MAQRSIPWGRVSSHRAAITHIVHYAGWAVGMTAFKVLDEVWPEEAVPAQ